MAGRNFDLKNIKRRLQIVLNNMKLRLFYINYIVAVAFVLCIKQLCLCVSPNFWFCGSYQMVVTQAWNMPQGNETLWLCKYATNKIHHKVNFCVKFYSMHNPISSNHLTRSTTFLKFRTKRMIYHFMKYAGLKLIGWNECFYIYHRYFYGRYISLR